MLLAPLVCGLSLLATPAPVYARTPVPAPTCAATAPRDLSDLIRELRKADRPGIRINILVKIGALTESPDAPNAVANALARGLDDDSFLVATKAAELLGKRVKSDVALDHLVDACGALKKTREKAFEGQKKLADLAPRAGDDDVVESLRRFSAFIEEEKKVLEGLIAYETTLLDAVLKRRDDRCVEALADLLEGQVFGDGAWPIAEGLFAIGTVPAIQEVIDLFSQTEKSVQARAKEQKKIARQRPARVPKMWMGTKDAWKAREVLRIEGLVARHDAGTEAMRQWRYDLSAKVRELAKKADLVVPPATPKARDWENWWKDCRGALPKSLAD